jgi:hypothetical protein
MAGNQARKPGKETTCEFPLKAFTRARGRARRAIRGGDFAAAERWDRLAERQLKLAFLHERALDDLEVRKETNRLERINKSLEEQKNRASHERYRKAKARGPLLQQEIDRRAAEYAEEERKREWSIELMARQKAAELIRERAAAISSGDANLLSEKNERCP